MDVSFLSGRYHAVSTRGEDALRNMGTGLTYSWIRYDSWSLYLNNLLNKFDGTDAHAGGSGVHSVQDSCLDR
jgi:hypothetical protein